MQLVGGEFTQCVLRHQSVSLPARGVVRACIDSRSQVNTHIQSHAHIHTVPIALVCWSDCLVAQVHNSGEIVPYYQVCDTVQNRQHTSCACSLGLV